jgi:hypothetical protein
MCGLSQSNGPPVWKGPFNGAKFVAKPWTDPAFKALLIEDTMAAVAQRGVPTVAAAAEAEHVRAVANTPQVHNLIICTLWSCYPWSVLGLPRSRSIPPRKSAPGLAAPASVGSWCRSDLKEPIG